MLEPVYCGSAHWPAKRGGGCVRLVVARLGGRVLFPISQYYNWVFGCLYLISKILVILCWNRKYFLLCSFCLWIQLLGEVQCEEWVFVSLSAVESLVPVCLSVRVWVPASNWFIILSKFSLTASSWWEELGLSPGLVLAGDEPEPDPVILRFRKYIYSL